MNTVVMKAQLLSSGARIATNPLNVSRRVTVAPIARRSMAVRAAATTQMSTSEAVERAAFGFSGLVDAAAGVSGLLAPAAFYNIIGVATPTGAVLMSHYIASAVATVAAVAAARCYSATQRNRLNSDTYQRLTLSLALQNAAVLPLMYLFGPGFGALAPALRAYMATKLVIGVTQLGIWSTKSSRPAALLKDTFGGVGDVLTVPNNLLSAMYSALSIGAVALGLSYLQAPAGATWLATFLSKLAGVKCFAAAGFLYTLKNGSDRNCLGRGTFKQLNEGVAVAAAVLGGIIYSGVKAGTTAASNETTALLAAAGITAAVCAYQGVAAVINKGKGGTTASPVGDDRGNYKYEKEDPLDKYCSDNPDAEECKVFED